MQIEGLVGNEIQGWKVIGIRECIRPELPGEFPEVLFGQDFEQIEIKCYFEGKKRFVVVPVNGVSDEATVLGELDFILKRENDRIYDGVQYDGVEGD